MTDTSKEAIADILDAPERIWFNGSCITEHMHTSWQPFAGGEEYIRAALHAEAIEAAEQRGYARGIEDALNKVSGCDRVSEVGPALRALAELKGENQ